MIELRPQFPLAALLRAAGLARSTFYYQQAALQVVDKYAAIKDQIKAIYERHKGRYGYRRITEALRRQGSVINHKTVQRLMEELELKSLVRVKRYRSYRGQVGQIAPNLIDRDSDAARPNEKWVTDVTEFKVDGKKLYLSPVMDLFNGEIVAYTTARRPLFSMVGTMLKRRSLASDQMIARSYIPIKAGNIKWISTANVSMSVPSRKACHARGIAWTMLQWKASSGR